ncbi:MAG TPA: antibiotic biosynthesis monooxygenase [Candidatus Kryptonia bacterium]
MISRIWHGYTNMQNADKYERLLKEEIFVGIGDRKINGYRGIQLLKRLVGSEAEFITIMSFDNINAVKEFSGEDYESAVVPGRRQRRYSRTTTKGHSTTRS